MRAKLNAARILANVCCFALCDKASAFEPLFAVNASPGITSGLPYAANPPPGVHFFNLANTGTGRFEGRGSATGLDRISFSGFTNSSVLFWSTSQTLLGGRFAAFAVGSWTQVGLYDGDQRIAQIRGFHNPGISPVSISWDLGGGLFARAGILVWAPVGTRELGPLNNGLGNIGAPYWTIEPNVAVSYLADGWNLTANIFYGFSTKNTVSGVVNGNSLTADFTATRKINGIEIGPVGYISTQVTADKGCEPVYGNGVCAFGTKAGVGALIGYDFGRFNARVAVTDSVINHNAFDGWKVWTSLTVSLTGGP